MIAWIIACLLGTAIFVAWAVASVNSEDQEDAQRELEEQQRKLRGRRPQ